MTPTNADLTLVGAAGVNAGNLRVIAPQPADVSGAGWYDIPIGVAPGLATDFDFTIAPGASGAAEGFAFVIQSSDPTALGGVAANLCYAGIANAAAVEFDSFPDAPLPDPTYQHIAMHTRYDLQNSADETYALGQSSASRNLTLSDGLSQHAHIEYTRAAGLSPGWIRVWTYANDSPMIAPERIAPTLVVQVSSASLGAVAAPNAYLGFTAGSSSSVQETVDIADWSITPISPSAARTLADQPPATLVGGQPGQVTIQLRDACGNPLGASGVGYGSSLAAQLVDVDDPGTAVPVEVTDNADGSYTLAYTPLVAGAYQLSVTLAGTPIGGSPFALST